MGRVTQIAPGILAYAGGGDGYGIELTITVIEPKGYCFASKSPLIQANLVPIFLLLYRKEKQFADFMYCTLADTARVPGFIAFRLENMGVPDVWLF